MHPVYILAFVTFALVLAFAAWSYLSSRRHRTGGRPVAGMGGANDPLAGETSDVRRPEALRAGLDS